MTTKQESKPSGTINPSATDHQQIAWQFGVGELEPVESWPGRHSLGSSGLIKAPEPTLEIIDPNYDTDDRRFYAARYALCARKTEGDVRDPGSAIPDSRRLRSLHKGEEWKKFRNVLEDQKASGTPSESVR